MGDKQDDGEDEIHEGEEEVFRFDNDDKSDLRERKREADKRRAVAQARARGEDLPKSANGTSTVTTAAGKPRKPREIPGGVIPMVLFIVAFNAAALVALATLFPAQSNGARKTPWGSLIAKPTIPWPEMLTLLIGHVLGFSAWATFVYFRYHKRTLEDGAGEPPSKSTRKKAEDLNPPGKSTRKKASDDEPPTRSTRKKASP